MSLIKKGGTKIIKPIERDEDRTKAISGADKRDEDRTKGIAGADERDEGTRTIPGADKRDEDRTKGIAGADERDEGTRTMPGANERDENQTRDRLGTITPGSKAAAQSTSTTDDDPMLPAETVLQSRYVIESVLGVGGMSAVYRGRDTRFKDVVRPCAIKEMYQRSPDSQTRMLSLRFFEREAGMLATLNHPAIPKVYDFFEENGRAYLVMELVEGQDLEEVLEKAGKPLSEEQVGQWAVQVCDVLAYLHNHQPDPIVFRDMKPSNIMVTADNHIKMVDFGIARSFIPTNQKGTMIGTEGYAAPEQFRGIAEPASDIYALGATLHQLLTHSDPRLETPFTFHERPIRKFNPAVSREMEAAITRALEYSVDARWPSAAEFKEALLSIGIAGAAIDTVASPRPTARNRISGTELVWRFKCEDELRSSPYVSDGMLYIGCYDTNIYALDVERGEFRWKYATEGGINSSPVVWQELVVISSEDGKVYALDRRQGRLRWSHRTEKQVRSSPRIEDRIIFIGSDDQHFYALDGMRNGTTIWKYRAWAPFRSSACITSTAVYTGCNDGNIYCLDVRNGALKWKQRTQQPVISTPVSSDDMIIVGSTDFNLYALDAEGGFPIWRFRTGNMIYSSPTVVGKNVLVGSADGNMYAVDKKSGRQAWKFETGSQIASSPRVDSGRVYFGAADGCIYCLDTSTGEQIWKYQTEGPVVSSAAIVNGVVYIASMDENVYALKA